MGNTLYASLGDVRYVRSALVKCTFFGKVLEARGGSGATRDEVHTMLSRLPDHGIVIIFHITFIIY